MKIIGIVAVDNNWGIGKNNGLLFSSLKEDMRNFKELTSGHFVVCGYNTLLSFPGSRPLKDRVTICIAPEGIKRDDCIIVHTFEDCMKLLTNIGTMGSPVVYIIGGAMVYKTFLPIYDEVLVTKVDAVDSEATVFFPNLDKEKDFKIISKSNIIKDGEYNIRFVKYKRRK